MYGCLEHVGLDGNATAIQPGGSHCTGLLRVELTLYPLFFRMFATSTYTQYKLSGHVAGRAIRLVKDSHKERCMVAQPTLTPLVFAIDILNSQTQFWRTTRQLESRASQ